VRVVAQPSFTVGVCVIQIPNQIICLQRHLATAATINRGFMILSYLVTL